MEIKTEPKKSINHNFAEIKTMLTLRFLPWVTIVYVNELMHIVILTDYIGV
jgi:hypothetical protein